MVKDFSRAIRVISPELYVAAPDMYMSEQEMAWFAEANGDRTSCTGKPETMGGLPHELGGTGFGVYHAVRVACRFIGLDLKGASFAMEGFGSLYNLRQNHLTLITHIDMATQNEMNTPWNCHIKT